MRVLLSSEVAEEITEILDQLPEKWEVIVSAPSSLQGRVSGYGERVQFLPARFAATNKKIHKLKSLLHFVSTVRTVAPDVIISGFPLMKHRVASQFAKRPHVSYIRGLMFDAAVLGGFSGRLESSKLARLLPKRLVTSMHSDHFVTVSPINRDFLEARGFAPSSISECGPVWLRSTPVLSSPTSEIRRVVICTSALAEHGFNLQHVTMVDDFADAIVSLKSHYEVSLRVHPRDFYDYASDWRFRNIEILKGTPEAFLSSLTTTDVLLSHPSTLSYEVGYLGVRSAVLLGDSVLQSPASLVAARLPLIRLAELPDLLHDRVEAIDLFSIINMNALSVAVVNVTR